MQLEKKEITGQFFVKTVEGRRYRIIEYSRYLNIGTVSDYGDKWEFHSHSHTLENNYPVNHVDGDVYEIVSTGERAIRIR